jgi:hypothetical protein
VQDGGAWDGRHRLKGAEWEVQDRGTGWETWDGRCSMGSAVWKEQDVRCRMKVHGMGGVG